MWVVRKMKNREISIFQRKSSLVFQKKEKEEKNVGRFDLSRGENFLGQGAFAAEGEK